MRCWVLAFVFGVVVLQVFSHLPSLVWVSGVTFTLMVLWGVAYRVSVRQAAPYTEDNKKIPQGAATIVLKILSILAAFSLGLLWSLVCMQWQLSHALPKDLENKELTVIGSVATIPELRGLGVRFDFAIEQCQEGESPLTLALSPANAGERGQFQPLRVRLSWYQTKTNLHVGERWQLQVKLKQPHGFHNPGSFNYETALLAHHISATGYVRESPQNSLLSSPRFSHPLDRIRQLLDERLNQALHGYPLAGQIKALTIGMGDAISAPQWEVFKATGTVHLMVIAGLHIGLVSGFVFAITLFFWRRSARLTLRLPAIQAASSAALLMAWIYSALAGFSIPTQRAVIMISVFMGMQLLRRQLQAWNAYCLALFIVVLLDPLATLEAGFWLSFAAVGLIIYGITGRLRSGNHWSKLARIQIVLGVGLIPVTLLWFQQASFSGVIANAIAIPWVGFVVAPLSLIGAFFSLFAPSVGAIFLVLAEKAMEWFWPILAWMAHLKFASWQQAIPNTWVLSASLMGVLLLLAPKGFPARWLGAIALLPLFCYMPPGPKAGEAWFTLLDVGQGLAAVVRTQHNVLVFDTGPKFSPDFDTGNAVVVPYLRSQGIKRLTTLVISHQDNDHIGGAASLLAAYPAEQIYTSVPQRFPTGQANYCLRGKTWNWDGVEFKFLYPDPDHLNLDNNSSCVLRVATGKKQVLLTGDIEKQAEHYLLENNIADLSASILVAPHHGSKTSSTAEFVQAVHPAYVLFPVGYLNKFHFPKPEVVGRYQAIGAKTYDTAQYGAISFRLDPTECPPHPNPLPGVPGRGDILVSDILRKVVKIATLPHG